MMPTPRLDAIHTDVVSIVKLRVFTAVVRVLLALAFTPSGLVKVLGHRFTLLPVTDPVGYFFDALYQAQGYYRFIGFCQLIAAGLLLFPSTATMGAVIYFPIILNIFVITLSVDFGNTRFITGAMALGCLYLLLWDYDRWKNLLPRRESHHAGMRFMLPLFASAGIGLYGVTRLHLARLRGGSFALPVLEVAVAAGLGLLTLIRLMKTRAPE